MASQNLDDLSAPVRANKSVEAAAAAAITGLAGRIGQVTTIGDGGYFASFIAGMKASAGALASPLPDFTSAASDEAAKQIKGADDKGA